MEPRSLVLTPRTHRFFEQLVTAQAATAAYLKAHLLQAGSPAQAYKPGSPITQMCFTRNRVVEFQPIEVLGPITKFAWPPEIHLTLYEGGTPPSPSADLTVIQTLMASLYEHAFISYYEKNSDEMRAKYGSKRNFPDALNFGRIVRNAFAHGGKVNITDRMPGVWAGITYSEKDNGRQVLYHDLSSGDLTLLMIDMDAEI